MAKKTALFGALWKLALGVLLLAVEVEILWAAFAGDGWLQMSASAVGCWAWWAFMVWLSLFLLNRGIRDVRTARR
ncbi:MAG: hypothetical protein ABSC05_24035 [Candidatus Solibacter sp.]|jgi:hypothetical protein